MSEPAQISIPRDVLDSARLTVDEARVELAIHLYATGRLGFGKARQLAELPQFQFRQLLAGRDLTVQYEAGDLDEDLASLRCILRP